MRLENRMLSSCDKGVLVDQRFGVQVLDVEWSSGQFKKSGMSHMGKKC